MHDSACSLPHTFADLAAIFYKLPAALLSRLHPNLRITHAEALVSAAVSEVSKIQGRLADRAHASTCRFSILELGGLRPPSDSLPCGFSR